MVRIGAVSTLGKLNVDLTQLAALAKELMAMIKDEDRAVRTVVAAQLNVSAAAFQFAPPRPRP